MGFFYLSKKEKVANEEKTKEISEFLGSEICIIDCVDKKLYLHEKAVVIETQGKINADVKIIPLKFIVSVHLKTFPSFIEKYSIEFETVNGMLASSGTSEAYIAEENMVTIRYTKENDEQTKKVLAYVLEHIC